jgi:hypothetical protein
MRRFQLLDDGVTAEGFQCSDGRCVVLSMRVVTHPVLYATVQRMADDWRSSTLQWLDEEAKAAQ